MSDETIPQGEQQTLQRPKMIILMTHEGQPHEDAHVVECDDFVVLPMRAGDDGEIKVDCHVSDPNRPALLFYGMRTLAVGLQKLPVRGFGQFKLMGDMVVKQIHGGMDLLKKQVDKYKLEP